MACEDLKRYIIAPLQGIPGPQGPQGPQGPPGEAAQLPIAASDISVTNPGYANLQEVLDFLLYTAIEINSFTATQDVYEIGVTITSLTFNWSLTYDPISQTLTGPSITPPTLTSTSRNSTVAVSNLQGVNPGDSYTYTLQVNDGTNTPSRNELIYFYNGVYVGDAVIPGAVDSAFINTLNKTLQLTKTRTWTSNASGSEYTWAAWRTALGTATFQVGQFIGGFEAPVTVSHTNSSGYTEDYYVARSTNPDIGPVTITMN
jgi:hypothetical protein